jgi:hypothetical protein
MRCLGTKGSVRPEREVAARGTLCAMVFSKSNAVKVLVLALVAGFVVGGIVGTLELQQFLERSVSTNAREQFLGTADSMAKALSLSLHDASASLDGVHAVLNSVPNLSFWPFFHICSAFNTTAKHQVLEYVPYVRNASERLRWELEISTEVGRTLVFQQVRVV